MRLHTLSRALRSYNRCILSLVSQHLGYVPSCRAPQEIELVCLREHMTSNMQCDLICDCITGKGVSSGRRPPLMLPKAFWVNIAFSASSHRTQ